VFISRKDGKLYVRQNFTPLFDVPVTIAPSERMLGTHVFTAEVDKNDANALRWSVVSLPVAARNAQKNDDDERSSRRRKIAGVVPAEVKPPMPLPNSPAEALDRITIPPEAMARIAAALQAQDPARGIFDLEKKLGLPLRLADIGMKEADLERAARIATEAPYPNPRKVEYAPVLALLQDAYAGRRPS
jgi:hypothetical protein